MSSRSLSAAAATAALLALPAAAGAHVTVSPERAPADGYAIVDLTVPHGCEASPTTKLIVQLPDQVVSAVPEEVAGWTVTTREGRLARPYDSHGERVTQGVREVTWSGGPLAADHMQRFGLSVRFAGRPGESAPFKAIQRCKEGRTAWVELPVDGQAEPEHPAPAVTLTAGEDAHAAGGAGAPGTAEPVDAEVVAATVAEPDDTPSTGLVIAALVVGALALVAALAALARGRRTAG